MEAKFGKKIGKKSHIKGLHLVKTTFGKIKKTNKMARGQKAYDDIKETIMQK